MTQNCRDTNTNCIKTAKTHKPKDLFQHKQKQKIQTADTNCKHRYKVKLQTDTKTKLHKNCTKNIHTHAPIDLFLVVGGGGLGGREPGRELGQHPPAQRQPRQGVQHLHKHN